MSLTLVVLAAGLGSRYGGLKQIDGVGPSGEFLLDYAVYDAVRAGFSHLVLVTRPDVEQALRTRFERMDRVASVRTINQGLDDIPAGMTVPGNREKPWGTTHAVLVTEPLVATPFAVINADDFYGADAFRLLQAHFASAGPGTAGPAEAAMVAYTLRDTLSPLGNVARGICEASPDGWVTRVTEVKQIKEDRGVISGVDDRGQPWTLSGDEPTSMNFFGFTPAIYPLLRQSFEAFLAARRHDPTAESYISNTMDGLIAGGTARLRMYRTSARWFGMTNRGDREAVVAEIARLVAAGAYPPNLFER
jgi:hypothetical protein